MSTRPSARSLEPTEIEPLLDRRSETSLTRVSTTSSSTAHSEAHSDYGNMIRDIIIGFADGLTVPFALTAGLSSLGDTRLVVMGGLAELFSGAISMGLGAYLAASTEKEHYESEEKREWDEVARMPDAERQEIYDVLAKYRISYEAATPLVTELCKNPEMWVRFMMDFELRLEKPETSHAWLSALTMGLSYFIGGLIPMVPYFFLNNAMDALLISVIITVIILLVFGYVKTAITVHSPLAGCWGAVQTLFIGALAAGAAYGIVRLLDAGN